MLLRRKMEKGAGPRAGLNLIMAAKAHAILHGQLHVGIANIDAVAPPILRHRLIIGFAAQSEGVTVEDIIRKLLATVPKNVKD